MGNVAGYRQAFADAQDYQRQWDAYRRDLAEYQNKTAQKATAGDAKSKDAKPKHA